VGGREGGSKGGREGEAVFGDLNGGSAELEKTAKTMGGVEGRGKDEDQGRGGGRAGGREGGEGLELAEEEGEEDKGLILPRAHHHLLLQCGRRATHCSTLPSFLPLPIFQVLFLPLLPLPLGVGRRVYDMTINGEITRVPQIKAGELLGVRGKSGGKQEFPQRGGGLEEGVEGGEGGGGGGGEGGVVGGAEAEGGWVDGVAGAGAACLLLPPLLLYLLLLL